MKTTKNINENVLKDALNVSGSMYKMNAPTSRGYAFCCGENEVSYGEFIFFTEDVTVREFDGFIDFDNKLLHDLESDEAINLINCEI